MKKKATKLLAVVAIATSPGIVLADRDASNASRTSASNASGSTATTSNGAIDPWDPPRDPWNATSAIDPDRVRVSLAGLEGTIALVTARQTPAANTTALVTARPRQMPSGAPACGNVASRAPRPADCTQPAASPTPILARTNTTTNRTAITTRTRVTGETR